MLECLLRFVKTKKLQKGFFFIALIALFFVFTTTAFANELEDGARIIHMADDRFNPQDIVIDQGFTVVFENVGKEDHWPASNIHPTHDIYPEFDPKKPIPPGQSWQFIFDKAGTWRYHDHLNPFLQGVITVRKEASQQVKTQIPLIRPKQNSIASFFDTLRIQLALFHFRLFPHEKDVYLTKQNIKQLIDKHDDKQLSFLITLVGPERLMQRLYDESMDGRFYCHTYSHIIGQISYELLGAGALEKNIATCQSGYTHGVMEGFVKSKGSEDIINQVTQLCEQLKTNFGKITCYHGIGHGFMAYFNNELPIALARCRQLSDASKQENCLTGAFMENIVSGIEENPFLQKTQWLNPKDLVFPCNAIDQAPSVQRMCYTMQSQWIRYVFRNQSQSDRMDRIIEACLSIKDEYKKNCFFGYGKSADFEADFNPRKTVLLCEKVPTNNNYRDSCFIGAESLILDSDSNIQKRIADFCLLLPEYNRKACYRILDDRLKDHSNQSLFP